MKLCKIMKPENVKSIINKSDEIYVPLSDHESAEDCERAAKEINDADKMIFVAVRVATPFTVKTKITKTIEKIEHEI